jgi:hypothetical protein
MVTGVTTRFVPTLVVVREEKVETAAFPTPELVRGVLGHAHCVYAFVAVTPAEALAYDPDAWWHCLVGASGHDPFENDDALDLLDAIAGKDFDFDDFRERVDGDGGVHESSDGELILALAALSRIVHDDAPVPE